MEAAEHHGYIEFISVWPINYCQLLRRRRRRRRRRTGIVLCRKCCFVDDLRRRYLLWLNSGGQDLSNCHYSASARTSMKTTKMKTVLILLNLSKVFGWYTHTLISRAVKKTHTQEHTELHHSERVKK